MRLPAINLSRSTITIWASWVVYLVLILLAIPPVISWIHRIIFFLYAIFIFWTLYPTLKHEKTNNAQDSGSMRRIWIALLIFSGLFLVASRLYMFIRYGATPLGYDTGFYLKFVGPDGFLQTPLPVFLHWAALYTLDISPVVILHAVYVLTQLLIAGALYSLIRTLTNLSRLSFGAIILFLFAVSLTQFFAYWWMFYQTMLAIAFLLITLTLIYRRSFLAILTGGFGIAIHPITFAPLGIAIILFVLIQGVRSLVKRQWTDYETRTIVIISGFMALLAVLLRGTALFKDGVSYLTRHQFLISNFPLYEQPQAAGLFIDLAGFQLTILYIIPFAVLGLLLFFLRIRQLSHNPQDVLGPRLLLLFLFFVTLFTLAYFPFIYQHRFLIYLDLVIMIFAAYPLVRVIEYFWQDHLGRGMVILLLSGLVLNSSLIVWNQEPQLFPEELPNIKMIAHIAESNAYAMSVDGIYTPWVYGFSDRDTIAPGYLYWDRWNLPMWNEFWSGKSNSRRHELLQYYDRPLYIFIGKRLNADLPYQKFIREDPHFRNINPQVWRYDPARITLEEIAAMKRKEIAVNKPPSSANDIPTKSLNSGEIPKE